MPVACRLVIAAGLLLPVSTASAQTLADVARRTAVERTASDPAVTKLTDRDLPSVSRLESELRDFTLTEDQFYRYAEARYYLLHERITSANIDAWLLRAERDGVGPEVMEGMLQQEPALIKVLDWQRISAHAYILTDVAFGRALGDATQSDDALARMPAARAANARFVRDNPHNKVQAARYHWGEKQRELEQWRQRR